MRCSSVSEVRTSLQQVSISLCTWGEMLWYLGTGGEYWGKRTVNAGNTSICPNLGNVYPKDIAGSDITNSHDAHALGSLKELIG